MYLRYLVNDNFKFDEIALLIFARMYQLHVGIILDNKYWSTHRQQTMENFETSDIVLAYAGNLHFLDTVKHKITVDNIELPPHILFSLNMSYFTSWSGKTWKETKSASDSKCLNEKENQYDKTSDTVDNGTNVEGEPY